MSTKQCQDDHEVLLLTYEICSQHEIPHRRTTTNIRETKNTYAVSREAQHEEIIRYDQESFNACEEISFVLHATLQTLNQGILNDADHDGFSNVQVQV